MFQRARVEAGRKAGAGRSAAVAGVPSFSLGKRGAESKVRAFEVPWLVLLGPMPKHLYSLDVARGIAALSVVLWHWSHFYYAGHPDGGEFVRSEQPLYPLFFLFYERGALAVDFFFSLSGFVFFWLYSRKIADRGVGTWQFVALRFSRLYPLHLLTLLVVAGLAALYTRAVGGAFVFPHNDLYHFVLQLFFASHWGLQAGHSFNGPIWSVSVEVLLYAIFFLLCRYRLPRLPQVLGLIVIGFLMKEFVYGPVGRGIFSFYVGGLCYYLMASGSVLVTSTGGRKFLYGMTAAAWLFAILSTGLELGTQVVEAVPALSQRAVLAGKLIDKLAFYYGAGALFPLTILTLVTVEVQRGGLGRRISFIGDVSYSSYLLHFPLQLLLVVVFAELGLSFEFFEKPLAILLFYAILIPLSLASYHWFERPMQRVLRARMLPSREPAATPSEPSPAPEREG